MPARCSRSPNFWLPCELIRICQHTEVQLQARLFSFLACSRSALNHNRTTKISLDIFLILSSELCDVQDRLLQPLLRSCFRRSETFSGVLVGAHYTSSSCSLPCQLTALFSLPLQLRSDVKMRQIKLTVAVHYEHAANLSTYLRLSIPFIRSGCCHRVIVPSW